MWAAAAAVVVSFAVADVVLWVVSGHVLAG